MSKRLLNINDGCEAIGLGRSTLYRLIRTGQIETVKVGSRRLIPTEAIDQFIDSLKAGNQ